MMDKPEQLWRCVAYDLIMYPFTLLLAIFGLPCLISYGATNGLSKIWIRGFVFLNRHILGIHSHFQPTALQQFPTPRRGVVIAAKHQSAWETLALRYYYPRAITVAKRELFWLPFGWYMWRLGYISVNRKGGARALQKMMSDVRSRLDAGFDVVIYPEGTRRPLGATPEYKTGIFGLYRHAKAQVLPLALDSGRYWAKRPMYRRPGVVQLQECAIVECGLKKDEFMAELEHRIETACHELEKVTSDNQQLKQ